MSVNVKANGQTYSLQETLTTTTKTVSTNPSLPAINVIQCGKIVMVRCSGYPKTALTNGTKYSTDLGIGSVALGTDYRLFPHGGQGWYTVHVTTDGALELTPGVDMAATSGVNFSIMAILA